MGIERAFQLLFERLTLLKEAVDELQEKFGKDVIGKGKQE